MAARAMPRAVGRIHCRHAEQTADPPQVADCYKRPRSLRLHGIVHTYSPYSFLVLFSTQHGPAFITGITSYAEATGVVLAAGPLPRARGHQPRASFETS